MNIDPARAGTDEQLLEMLADPHLPLADIAAINNLTLSALARWAEQPHILDTLRSLRRLARARAALIAAENIPPALDTLRTIAGAVEREERNHLPSSDPQLLAIRARTRETARKACTQLTRCATPRPHSRCHRSPGSAGALVSPAPASFVAIDTAAPRPHPHSPHATENPSGKPDHSRLYYSRRAGTSDPRTSFKGMDMNVRFTAALLAASAGTTLAQTPQYSVEILPQIQTPSGPMNVGGVALTEGGWAVGIYFTSEYDPYGRRVAVYRPGQGWQDIGHPEGLPVLEAADINNDGVIIGIAGPDFISLGGYSRPWSWENGVFTVYPQLAPPRETKPVALNDAGRIVGFASNAMVHRAVELTPGGTIDLLPTAPGGTMVYDINNNNVILGSELQGAFLWPEGGERRYFPPPYPVPLVEFISMNDRGDSVGLARATGHTETRSAVVWLEGAGWTILPRNARRCAARNINNVREVVGTSQDNAGAIGNHAWYWRPGMATVTPLEYLIADPPTGFYAVNGARDINENGEILAGVFVRATGVGSAAILRPIITEPLRLDLASDAPPALQAPGSPLRVDVRILDGAASYVPGSAQVYYRTGPQQPFVATPLAPVAGSIHTATLPAATCGDSPEFYISAQASNASTITLPEGAPASVFSTEVGTTGTATVLSERFDSGLPAGWSATGLWTATSSCIAPGGFCYDDGPPWMYYGRPQDCNIDTGGWNFGSLTSPPLTLPTIPPGGQLRLRYCSSAIWDIIGGSAEVDLLINGAVVDSPGWNWGWERRDVDLADFAGQTVSLEWRFDSGGIFGLQERGWMVDNIQLTATTSGCTNPPAACYANCDGSTTTPLLNVADFTCFLQRFAAADPYANCDASTTTPLLNVADFTCFLQSFASACP